MEEAEEPPNASIFAWHMRATPTTPHPASAKRQAASVRRSDGSRYAGSVHCEGDVIARFVRRQVRLDVQAGRGSGRGVGPGGVSHHRTPSWTFEGLWWASTTITTVGSGDVYPVTTAGRLVGVDTMGGRRT